MQVERINYEVNWQNFKRGTSIFIPCLNGRLAKKEVLRVMRRLRMKVLIKLVLVDNIQGLRIWRL